VSETVAPKVVYVVQEITWRFNDMWFYREDEGDGPFGYPIEAFTDRAKAESHRREKERQARKGENPFGYGEGLDDLSTTHTTDESMAALAQELGQPLPRSYGSGGYFSLQNWEDWWEWREKQLSPEQAERVWDAMDRVTFFEVLELPLGGKP
jgi:hypothetical protein